LAVERIEFAVALCSVKQLNGYPIK